MQINASVSRETRVTLPGLPQIPRPFHLGCDTTSIAS